MTVAIGRARTKSTVRVHVVTDGTEILRVDPDVDDVRAAAARTRNSVHAVAAEAIEQALALSMRTTSNASGTRAGKKRKPRPT